MQETWPWLAVAGLGLYHGLNPAMGWLFAVALGLHRRRQAVVLQALVPIATGHAASIALAAVAVAAAGLVIDQALVRVIAGSILLCWALYHVLYGSRHRVRVGMQTGLAGLALWSFLMASAHGAGLMLAPALIPLCLTGAPGHQLTASGSLATAMAAVGVHTAAMLIIAGIIALVVYHCIGVGFLRRGWINLDRLWVGALVATGLLLIQPW
ncbi:MAG: hypothetical protein JOZ40_01285 [Methylobacteriaceae bacterium]|nr:hypothetical protein [Methylobacteriaceae bacterium]